MGPRPAVGKGRKAVGPSDPRTDEGDHRVGGPRRAVNRAVPAGARRDAHEATTHGGVAADRGRTDRGE
jgi:hypothetical protein